jgi:hypothetical protein
VATRTLNALGAAGIVTGATAFGALLISGGLPEAVFVPWLISASGVAAVRANMLRLSHWRRQLGTQAGAGIVSASKFMVLTTC